jgi:hypothetical protein
MMQKTVGSYGTEYEQLCQRIAELEYLLHSQRQCHEQCIEILNARVRQELQGMIDIDCLFEVLSGAPISREQRELLTLVSQKSSNILAAIEDIVQKEQQRLK